MPLTSPGNDDDTGENHQPTLRKNTAEPVEQTLKQNSRNGFAVVAQLAEQRPRNAQVTGPNPVDGSFSTKTDLFFLLCLAGFREVCNRTGVEDSGTAAVAQLAEQPPCKRQVVGS